VAAGWRSRRCRLADGGGAGGGASGGGGGGAHAPAPPLAAPEPEPELEGSSAGRVRIPPEVPGFRTRELLAKMFEEGGIHMGYRYDPLYLWTPEARKSAWKDLSEEARRVNSNNFGERAKVRRGLAAGARELPPRRSR
jgi:hypothetical protein